MLPARPVDDLIDVVALAIAACRSQVGGRIGQAGAKAGEVDARPALYENEK